MGNISFGARAANLGKDVKNSTVTNTLEQLILSAHERYFNRNSGNYDHEESVLYNCVVRYFTRVSG